MIALKKEDCQRFSTTRKNLCANFGTPAKTSSFHKKTFVQFTV